MVTITFVLPEWEIWVVLAILLLLLVGGILGFYTSTLRLKTEELKRGMKDKNQFKNDS